MTHTNATRHTKSRKYRRQHRGVGISQNALQMERPNIIAGKIYSDTCGHCIQMAPEWEKVEAAFKSSPCNVEIINVAVVNGVEDSTAKNKISDRIGSPIEFTYMGVPTIYKIENGGPPTYYEGDRTADRFINWIQPKHSESTKGGRSKQSQKRRRRYRRSRKM